ncbi:alpha/beta fold hydrolase [Alcanivorax sediminis]|uniref:Alpha/beta fold hydrolase n=1 Tax=Alcanivorax sediminis TaxID=2663008 RepID=A0A6N7LT85_9GAMM|nr:alpha/beta hydrolase [Alcanivorax sediminis]MQX53472.1 alpha/beta fold hydrolase [Alcanivorax sediminis]
MKLILLPGMDGTGMLFEPLLNELGELDTEVVPLPNSGPQDYASLAEVVAHIIGERECVLLAESYSGAIAEFLVRNYSLNIRHIIFVASFLSSPRPFLSRLAAFLPIKALAAIPILAPFALKALMLGWSANPETISLFRKALREVDSRVLSMRLRQIAEYGSAGKTFEIGSTYIRPSGDLLVSDRSKEISAAFPNLKVVEVRGPHFVLQAEPEACAAVIRASVGHLTSKGNGTPSM